MRPHLQPAFPCLAGFFSVWRDVDFVNILKCRSEKLRHFSFYPPVQASCISVSKKNVFLAFVNRNIETISAMPSSTSETPITRISS